MRHKADFHIHSFLSPCAAPEMAPDAIVQKAKAAGLDAIALSDHNCAFNLPAFGKICERRGMACLFGMEVTSAEEAHILCLFDDLEKAMLLGERVYASLPPVPNQPGRFGDQRIVDENGEILGFAEKFLLNASAYAVGALVAEVHSLGGLCIPAHIDRRVYGIVAQLGSLPDEPFDAVELTPSGNPALARHYPVVRNSDSHELDTLGSAFTELEVETLTAGQIRSSLWKGKTPAPPSD